MGSWFASEWSGGLRAGRWFFFLGLVGAALAFLAWMGTGARLGLVGKSGRQPRDLLSPFPNTRPGVRYVGDAACVRCHADIARSYRQHPMGRSLRPVDEENAGDISPEMSRVFEAQGLEYSVRRESGRLLHTETKRGPGGGVVVANEAEVKYAIGSGEQAMAFLLERGDGYLFESPITWYSGSREWSLSPGYESDNPHFERMVKPACLFCHSNQFDHVEGTENRYRRPIFNGHAIGCERCHGPGELHVKTPDRRDGELASIVNPADLAPSLREAVCQQCHLQGDIRVVRPGRELTDFRPGFPLHAIESVFVRADKARNSRFFGQVEQMHESRCFRASEGKLGCISCHDPHRLPEPAVKDAYYRERCLNCHADRGCRLPAQERLSRAPGDACTVCHMPRSTNEQIPHTATTLHLIPRFADRVPTTAEPGSGSTDRASPLIHFHRDQLDAEGLRQVERDLGIALTSLAGSLPGLSATATHRLALPLLEAATADDPGDVAALEAKSKAFWRLGRREDALGTLRTALEVEPEREETLILAGAQAAQLGRQDEAIADLDRAIRINPWRADYHQVLALQHSLRQDWRVSTASARDCLRLNPINHEARMLLIQSLIKGGKVSEARDEFRTLMDLEPPNREAMEAWFAKNVPPER